MKLFIGVCCTFGVVVGLATHNWSSASYALAALCYSQWWLALKEKEDSNK